MRALAAPLLLVAARARRRPGRWLLPAVGLALATAFASAVAAEGVIAGDRAARVELSGLGALQRSVRVTWEGPLSAGTDRRARQLLRGVGLSDATRIDLLSPVRLDGVLVRPAAIDPLARWVYGGAVVARLGRCRARRCPVLLAGGGRLRGRTLTALGVRLEVVGTTHAALGRAAGVHAGPGRRLSPAAHWRRGRARRRRRAQRRVPLPQLAGAARRVAPAELGVAGPSSSGSYAPRRRCCRPTASSRSARRSRALDGARSAAAAAPRRLLLAGGGALAALAMFVVLAAYGLRRDQARASFTAWIWRARAPASGWRFPSARRRRWRRWR